MNSFHEIQSKFNDNISSGKSNLADLLMNWAMSDSI